MNTYQIETILNHNKYTKNFFTGVFPIDKIPKYVKKPALLVINTDSSNKPGKHWLALFLPQNGCIEYFDSYGLPPIEKKIITFLKHNTIEYNFLYNNKRLQDAFSTVCGQYCCVYLWFRARNIKMKFFLNIFNKMKYMQNDKLIQKLFDNIFDLRKIQKNKYQICKSCN